MAHAMHTWLTIEDIAAELGVSIHSVRKWFAAGAQSGRCPQYIRPGKRILIRRDWFPTSGVRTKRRLHDRLKELG